MFDAQIEDPDLIGMILANSRRYSDNDLQKMAWEDAWKGGKGRANAILALGLDDLENMYRVIPRDRSNGPVRVAEHQLDENVRAILRYRRGPLAG